MPTPAGEALGFLAIGGAVWGLKKLTDLVVETFISLADKFYKPGRQ